MLTTCVQFMLFSPPAHLHTVPYRSDATESPSNASSWIFPLHDYLSRHYLYEARAMPLGRDLTFIGVGVEDLEKDDLVTQRIVHRRMRTLEPSYGKILLHAAYQPKPLATWTGAHDCKSRETAAVEGVVDHGASGMFKDSFGHETQKCFATKYMEPLRIARASASPRVLETLTDAEQTLGCAPCATASTNTTRWRVSLDPWSSASRARSADGRADAESYPNERLTGGYEYCRKTYQATIEQQSSAAWRLEHPEQAKMSVWKFSFLVDDYSVRSSWVGVQTATVERAWQAAGGRTMSEERRASALAKIVALDFGQLRYDPITGE